MSVFEGGITWVDLCEGKEAKLFSYILGTMNRETGTWTNNRLVRQAVFLRHGIADSTQLEYLRRFITKGLLTRRCRR